MSNAPTDPALGCIIAGFYSGSLMWLIDRASDVNHFGDLPTYAFCVAAFGLFLILRTGSRQ